MIRVLHFYKSFFPNSTGGVERVILEIIQSNKIFGVESAVLTTNNLGRKYSYTFEDIKVYSVPAFFKISSTPLSIQAIFEFKKLVKEFDIVHFHFPYPMADILNLFNNKKSIVTYHSDIVKQKNMMKIYAPIMRRYLRNVDKIVATSENYLKSSQILSALKKNIEVIPIGISTNQISQPKKERVDYWQRRFGKKFFLFLGVFRYYKGLNFLVEAASSLPYPIVIAGSGEMEVSLKKITKDRNIKNIFFPGFIAEEDKSALIKASYAFLFPSHLRSEAFGVSLLEAACLSKPMISCEIGTGTSYVNLDKETGIVIKPGSPEELKKAMSSLWNDPDLVGKYGNSARSRFINNFTSKIMGKRYLYLYQKLTNG